MCNKFVSLKLNEYCLRLSHLFSNYIFVRLLGSKYKQWREIIRSNSLCSSCECSGWTIRNNLVQLAHDITGHHIFMAELGPH